METETAQASRYKKSRNRGQLIMEGGGGGGGQWVVHGCKEAKLILL